MVGGLYHEGYGGSSASGHGMTPSPPSTTHKQMGNTNAMVGVAHSSPRRTVYDPHTTCNGPPFHSMGIDPPRAACHDTLPPIPIHHRPSIIHPSIMRA